MKFELGIRREMQKRLDIHGARCKSGQTLLGRFLQKLSSKSARCKSGPDTLGAIFPKYELYVRERDVKVVQTLLGRFFEIHRFTNSFRPTFVLATLEQTWLESGLRPDPRWGSTRKNVHFY